MFIMQWFHLIEKIFKNIGVYHSFEKMKPQLFFFLKKPSLVELSNHLSTVYYTKNILK